MINKNSRLLLLIIVVVAFLVRIYGLNWDQGQHLHPDERFMTMVSSSINIPKNLSLYFSQSKSPLNPYNQGYNFYVYGIFPLLLVRSLAEYLRLISYDQIFIVGRILSAVFDGLTVILVYKISNLLFRRSLVALLAAFIYSLAVFPVQQSHFFTVDPITVFLFTLSSYLFLRYLSDDKSVYLFLAGSIFGLTLASKTSLVVVFPLFFIILLYQKIRRYHLNNFFKLNNLAIFVFQSFLLVFFTALSFRIFQPYAFNCLFTPFPRFISNINEAHDMITGAYDYPPNMQWTGTLPFIHPFVNIFFAGFGVLNTILALLGIYFLIRSKKFLLPSILFILSLFTLVFSYQSFQLAKYMRYFYPIYPLLAVFAAYGYSNLSFKFFSKKYFLYALVLFNALSLFAFLTIYSHPHSRYQASLWIYSHLPLGQNISDEVWDDSLPLNLPGFTADLYAHTSLDLYQPESAEKWQKINNSLRKINLMSLSSNRLWVSIPRNPQRYPQTTAYYQQLFNGSTPFKFAKKFYSYPGFSLPFFSSCYLIGPTNYPGGKNSYFEIDPDCNYPGIYFRDDTLEESFTVYDHPEVILFTNNKK